MPRKDKIKLEQIKTSLFTLCTECGYKILPAEERRAFRLDRVFKALPNVLWGVPSVQILGVIQARRPQMP